MLGRNNLLNQCSLVAPNRFARLLGVTAISLLGMVNSALADSTYASPLRKESATAHYAVARTLLVQALAEFEQGRKSARPDMLLDPEEWRLSIISRTEELNRLLNPKERVTQAGVQIQANKLLIRREKDRTPPVLDGARDNNMSGEENRRSEMRSARARLEIPEDEPVKVIPRSEDSDGKTSTGSLKGKAIVREEVETDETPSEEMNKPDMKKVPSEEAKRAEQALTFPEEEKAIKEADSAALKVEALKKSIQNELPAEADSEEPIAKVGAGTKVGASEKAPLAEMKTQPRKVIDAGEEEVFSGEPTAPKGAAPMVNEGKSETAQNPSREGKKALFPEDEEDEGSSSEAPIVSESKDDEVTKAIDAAIQEKIHSDGLGGAKKPMQDVSAGE